MAVTYCKDFKHPAGFGFTGSAGQTAVKAHMRGGFVNGQKFQKGGFVNGQNFKKGGKTKKMTHKADGGLVHDVADKDDQYAETHDMKKGGKVPPAVKAAVHKHERHDHPGKPLTPLKKGGKAPAFGRKPMFGK